MWQWFTLGALFVLALLALFLTGESIARKKRLQRLKHLFTERDSKFKLQRPKKLRIVGRNNGKK